MSTIINLVQGSAAWLEYRRSMRNASETAAVLGISPWVTPYQLWLLKTGRKVQAVNAAMLNGTALEPEARSAYELETGHVMQPLVIQDGDYSASLDGITLQGDLIVEIKVPMRGASSSLWQAVAAGSVPGHYGAQLQHQLMVSGAAAAHLWVFDGSRGLLRVIERDESAMATIRDAWDGFSRFLATDTPPPLLPADTVLRDDAAWATAARAYAKAKQATLVADEALEGARQALVRLAGHAREEGAGVAVTRFWKAGNVDYKKVVELRGVDLKVYRGKAREEVRVTSSPL
jgi:putative phage-type endonuclease